MSEDVVQEATQQKAAEEPAAEKTAEKPAAAEPHLETALRGAEENVADANNLGILNDVNVSITIEIGRVQMKIKELLNLSKDSVVDLNKNAGEPVDVLVNGKLISKGTIIAVNGRYCVKLTSIPNIK